MSEWYKDWFNSGEYLQVYKHRNEQDADKLLKLIFDNLEIADGSKILDAACGAGRHAIHLAEKGFDVTGFDLSETLLEIAKNNARQKKLIPRFIKSDIRKFLLNETFSLVINLFTSFGYFEEDEDNFLFFKNAYQMLDSEGYLAFDYFNANYLVNNLIPETVKNIDGLEITERRKIKNNRVNKDILIEKEGNSKTFSESVKLYDADLLLDRFHKIGYKNFKIFGNFNGTDFNQETSERLIIICQK